VGTVEETETGMLPLPKVILKGGKNKLFQGNRRSVVVYPGAIDCVIGRPPPSPGSLVLLCDGKRTPLGIGVYNPDSLFQVRILEALHSQNDHFIDPVFLQYDNEDDILNQLIVNRIKQAVELRVLLGFGFAESHAKDGHETTGFRLVNSEGDFLPGLIVDVFGHIAVVRSSSIWIEQRKHIVQEALKTLVPDCKDVVWRPALDMLKMEGMDVNSHEEYATYDDENSQEGHLCTQIQEHGVKFLVSPYGQKTGFYVDQRENRLLLKKIARGKSVVDICCYSGGFAIYASLGGAESVQGVDSSESALELASKNATLNGCDIEFIKSDAAKFMDAAIQRGEVWDIVVLDPPKLAPSRSALTGATRKYVSLNTKALQIVRPGGLLMTCSCSGAMTQSHGEFIKVVQTAAHRTGRKVTLLSKHGAGCDHTLDPHYPEGEYLSNYLFKVW
jgi:23S rRNA G2069 N7-methylase RlmK/C1962 C5-methylase RlmI